MRSLLLSLAMVNLVQSSDTTMLTQHETRFGLTFTPTTIIASRFVSANIVNLTKFPTTAAYRDFYLHEVYATGASLRDTNDADFRSIANEAIRPLVDSLTEQLGYAAEFTALSLQSVVRRYFWSGVVAAVFGPDYITKLRATQSAACHAYGFLEGRILGRTPEECNEEGPENYVLVLEFEADYMYAWLMEVAFDLGNYATDRNKFCEMYGEKYRQVRCGFDQSFMPI